MLYQLRYSLYLRRPLLLASRVSNPNLVASEGYIPGSAILGAAAQAFLNNADNKLLTGGTLTVDRVTTANAHRDDHFYQWFLRGGLQFLNAYPVDETKRRLLPAPLSLLSEKDDATTLYDLTDDARLDQVQRKGLRLKGLDGFVAIDGDTAQAGSPGTRLRFHHSRPDRMKGRPDTGDGEVFVYEALEAGQFFGGRILGEKIALQEFLTATRWKPESVLHLGRSRTAEYGGEAVLTLESAVAEHFFAEVFAVCDETDNRVKKDTATPPSRNGEVNHTKQRLVVTLLSPLIGRIGGQPGAVFPDHDLAEALKHHGITNLKSIRSYCRPVWIGGFSSVWNLPRPQCQAIASGSVFILEADGAPLSLAALQQVEQRSLGIRCGEGFGRFAINWPPPGVRKRSGDGDTLVVRAVPKATGAPPVQFLRVYREARRRVVEETARSQGLKDGNSVKPLGPTEGINASQLGRLVHTLRGPDGLKLLQTLLEGLRKPAREQLGASRLQGDTVLQFLKRGVEKPEEVLPRIVLPKVPDIINLPDDKDVGMDGSEIIRVYLLSFCSQMARRKRPAHKKEEKADG